jgi:uncharacterized protein
VESHSGWRKKARARARAEEPLASGRARREALPWPARCEWSSLEAPRMLDPDIARRFLSHDRIAFVGLSTYEGDFSRHVARRLEQHGIGVVPVNPFAVDIGGEPAFARVTSIPEPPKAALLMVQPADALAVVKDCIASEVEMVWFHREMGGPSALYQDAIALAERAGLDIVTDACPLMFFEPRSMLHRTRRWLRSRTATATV